MLQDRHNHDTFELVRVSIDGRHDLPERFRIETVPTLIVVHEQKVKGRLIGPKGCRDLELFLRPWLRAPEKAPAPAAQEASIGAEEGKVDGRVR